MAKYYSAHLEIDNSALGEGEGEVSVWYIHGTLNFDWRMNANHAIIENVEKYWILRLNFSIFIYQFPGDIKN